MLIMLHDQVQKQMFSIIQVQYCGRGPYFESHKELK